MRLHASTPGRLYYSIGEVAEMTGVKPHVLRYWESEFPMLRPKKNRAGNRSYRARDIKIVLVIRDLLYRERFTISGARRKLQEHYGNPQPLLEQMQIPFSDPHQRHVLVEIRRELEAIRDLLSEEDDGTRAGAAASERGAAGAGGAELTTHPAAAKADATRPSAAATGEADGARVGAGASGGA